MQNIDIHELHAEWSMTDHIEQPCDMEELPSPEEIDLAATINHMEHTKSIGANSCCEPVKLCKGYMQNNTCCTYVAAEGGLCKMHGRKQYAECNICFDNMYVKQRLVCGHEFCRNCIYKWAGEDKTCPICRSSMVFTNHSKDTYIDAVKQMVYSIDQYVQDIKWKDAMHWLSAIEEEVYDCVNLMVSNEWMMHCTDDYKTVLSTYIGYGERINEKRFRKLGKIWKRIEGKKVFKSDS